MALFCMSTQWCNFLLWTTVDYNCERVGYNEAFCFEMTPVLGCFYIIAILPEFSLKRKSIQEPKDWINDEDSFAQVMEQLVS